MSGNTTFTNLNNDMDNLVGEVESFMNEYEEQISPELFDALEAIAQLLAEELNK